MISNLALSRSQHTSFRKTFAYTMLYVNRAGKEKKKNVCHHEVSFLTYIEPYKSPLEELRIIPILKMRKLSPISA